ncbi:MAG: Ig-like domain-containing protein [Ruminococcus flavefaciens]|nr:Ig-like domain-containing protein [Ruminococcus flavefaciens]
MKYEKRTNAKKITVNKAKAVLSLTNKKYKKTFQIKVKVKKENSKKNLLTHAAKLRYYTDDKKVAKVSKKGKITAVGKGKCTIYVIANNGVSKKIAVTVK